MVLLPQKMFVKNTNKINCRKKPLPPRYQIIPPIYAIKTVELT